MDNFDLFKSIINQDTASVVICNLDNMIVYMNPASIKRYHRDLTGSSIKDCHNAKSNEMIDKVVEWFAQSVDNNIMHTFFNQKENKDVYMVALRDDNNRLIGYYEKHEYRTVDTTPFYKFD